MLCNKKADYLREYLAQSFPGLESCILAYCDVRVVENASTYLRQWRILRVGGFPLSGNIDCPEYSSHNRYRRFFLVG